MAGITAVLVGCGLVSTYTYTQPATGEVIFGTDIDPQHSAVRNQVTSASLSATVGMAASFTQVVKGVTLVDAVGPDGQTVEKKFENPDPSTPYNIITVYYPLQALTSPGHYVFTLLSGSTTLATGAIDVTAPSPSP
jgi:hypothetical protein